MVNMPTTLELLAVAERIKQAADRMVEASTTLQHIVIEEEARLKAWNELNQKAPEQP